MFNRYIDCRKSFVNGPCSFIFQIYVKQPDGKWICVEVYGALVAVKGWVGDGLICDLMGYHVDFMVTSQ